MPEDTLRIERLDAGRLAELQAIEVRGYPYPWSERVMRDSFRAGTDCWGLLDGGGRILAYAFLHVAVGEAQLLNLCVDPDRHNQGLGRRLMQQLMREARQAFCTVFLLEVRRSNAAARHLYESLGFRTLGVRKNYYPNGPDASEDALVMAYEII